MVASKDFLWLCSAFNNSSKKKKERKENDSQTKTYGLVRAFGILKKPKSLS